MPNLVNSLTYCTEEVFSLLLVHKVHTNTTHLVPERFQLAFHVGLFKQRVGLFHLGRPQRLLQPLDLVAHALSVLLQALTLPLPALAGRRRTLELRIERRHLLLVLAAELLELVCCIQRCCRCVNAGLQCLNTGLQLSALGTPRSEGRLCVSGGSRQRRACLGELAFERCNSLLLLRTCQLCTLG